MARNGHEHLRPSRRGASRRGAPVVWMLFRVVLRPSSSDAGETGNGPSPRPWQGRLQPGPRGRPGQTRCRASRPGWQDGRSGAQGWARGPGWRWQERRTAELRGQRRHRPMQSDESVCVSCGQPQMSVVLPAIPATPKLGSAACRHMTGTRQIAPHARHGHFRSRWGCPAGSAWVCGFPEMSTQITVCPYRGACGGMAAARAADPLGERRGTCLRRAP